MKIIIPMAGMGKRMRPHTLTVPKPLIRIAGKPIVQRLVEQISPMLREPVEEVGFVIGDFGREVEAKLLGIAEQIGAKGRIFYQHEPLGTAHAVACAAEIMQGKIIVAFADTLFKADFSVDEEHDALIWVKEVEDPSAFGVVCTDNSNRITKFVEKPADFVSNKAIIGIYYFRDGQKLKEEIQYLVDNHIEKGGEYQLTDALQNMAAKGMGLYTGEVTEWLDCGNKNATVYANQRILNYSGNANQVASTAVIKDSIILQPCFIGDHVEINNSIIGPHVSVEEHTKINHSIITNSIVQSYTTLSNVNIDNSMIGNSVEYKGVVNDVSIGDYTRLIS